MSTMAFDEEYESRRHASAVSGEDDTWPTGGSEPCRRQMPPFPGSTSSRGPCVGRIDPDTGRCDWCYRPKRVAS